MAKKKIKETTRARGAELELRIDKAQELLLLGATDRMVEKNLMDRFQISRRTAARYIENVYLRWKESADNEDTRTLAEKKQQHEEMIKGVLLRAAQRENLPLQLRGIELLMRLNGTHEANKIELSGAGGGPISLATLTDEDLKKLVFEAGVE